MPFISVVYINECTDVNTALKKILQIYELFAKDPSVSKKFLTLASPRLYLDIFFQIYGSELLGIFNSSSPSIDIESPK